MGRLHCLLPWWNDATVDFMTSGGYNVSSLIRKVYASLQIDDELRLCFVIFMVDPL